MATEDLGSLVVRIETNLKNFNKGMDNVSDRVDRVGGGVKKLGGIIAGAFAVGAIVNFGKKGIQLASDLREVQNVVDTTFGAAAEKINEFASTAIEKFGLSELQAKQFAGSMGAMLKSSGLAGDKIIEMSTSLTGLAGDFASFYNLPHDEAWQKLRSGISGETEPLKQLGINMSVANLEAFALSKGVNKAWAEMTQAEQVTLRYNYLMLQSKDAQGDFNKTQNSFANLLRTVSQQLDGVIASLADKLLPKLEAFLVWIKAKMPEIKETATDAFNNISAAINFFRDNANILIPVIAGLTSAILAQSIIGGITSLYKAWRAATVAQTTAQWLLNIAMSANPIGLVAAAIGVLIAVGVLLWKNWDVVKEKALQLWASIKTGFNDLVASIKNAFSVAFDIGKNLIQGIINGMASVVSAVIQKAKDIASKIITTVKNILGIRSPSKEMEKIGRFIGLGLADGIEESSSKVIQQAKKLADATIKIFDKMGDAITTALRSTYKLRQEMLLKSFDAETQAKITSVQDQIDAIDGLTDQEDRALKEQAYLDRLAAIEKTIKTEEDAEKIVRLEKEKNEIITEHEREKLLEQRDNRKKALQEKIIQIEKTATEERENLNKQFEVLLKEETIQGEARRLLTDKNNTEIIELLKTYNPKWQDAGQSFGESLLNGLNSTKQSIQDAVNGILSLVNGADKGLVQVRSFFESRGLDVDWNPNTKEVVVEGISFKPEENRDGRTYSSAEQLQSILDKIPKFAKGTSYVPFDTMAFLHKGEAVVPANNNPGNSGATNPIGGIDYKKLAGAIVEAMSKGMPSITMDGQKVAKTLWPRLVAEKDRLGVSTL